MTKPPRKPAAETSEVVIDESHSQALTDAMLDQLAGGAGPTGPLNFAKIEPVYIPQAESSTDPDADPATAASTLGSPDKIDPTKN